MWAPKTNRNPTKDAFLVALLSASVHTSSALPRIGRYHMRYRRRRLPDSVFRLFALRLALRRSALPRAMPFVNQVVVAVICRDSQRILDMSSML